MALPKLNHLPFEIKIPSTGKGMMFRPYTVKEQKYLLMMKNETNQYEIVKLLQTLIGSCSLSETINISKLSYFDIIYIFVKLRAKSVGEIIDLKYKCNNNTNDQQCNNVVTIKLNLDEVQVNTNINNKNEFSVGNGITIKLRYPSLEAMADIEEFRKSNNIDYLIRGLAKCLEYVSDKETIYESFTDRKSTRLNSSHSQQSRMPSSA